MSTVVIAEVIPKRPPHISANIAGAFYLLTFVAGIAALVVDGRMGVAADGAATTANIVAHQSLFRAGLAANVIATACYIVVTALLYKLFAPVNRSVSFVAAFFGLVGCAIGGFGSALRVAPLILFNSPKYLSAFTIEQLQALSGIALKLNAQVSSLALVFFGFYCVLIGYLAMRSTFLPRTVGALMAIAGVGWLTFLWPPLANDVAPFNLAAGMIGEGALTVWLLRARVR